MISLRNPIILWLDNSSIFNKPMKNSNRLIWKKGISLLQSVGWIGVTWMVPMSNDLMSFTEGREGWPLECKNEMINKQNLEFFKLENVNSKTCCWTSSVRPCVDEARGDQVLPSWLVGWVGSTSLMSSTVRSLLGFAQRRHHILHLDRH